MTAFALALAGYVLLMLSNPLRESFRDGWRCIRRYPVIWKTLAWLGCANAVFQFVIRLTFQWRGVPQFQWFRESAATGEYTPVVWKMSPEGFDRSFDNAWMSALESVAGLFTNAVATFPIAAIAAGGFLLNRHRHFSILRSALKKRFGGWHWLIVAAIALCGGAVIAKAVIYLIPPGAPDEAWFRWAPVVALAAALWEYLFGFAVQVHLVLHAFAWVRGISFDSEAMKEVTIRRFASGARWAGVILALGLILIEFPLVLKNFPAWQGLFPNEPTIVESRLKWARLTMAIIVIGFASVQAWLALHGETLARALRSHLTLCKKHGGTLSWFILIAMVHLWAVNFARSILMEGLGHSTAAGVLWSFTWPWIAGPVSGWLLASWTCVFKRCESGVTTESTNVL